MSWVGFQTGKQASKAKDDKIKSDMAAFQQYEIDKLFQPLYDLLPQYEQRYNDSTAKINDLFSNAPNLDLSQFSKSLSGLSGDLTQLGKNTSSDLNNIRNKTTTGVNKYLGTTNDYIRSMLSESTTGADKYLQGYKDLARNNMPGLDIYNEQNQSNTASSIQQLKNLGVDSPAALVSILNNNNNTGANIALQAAQYKVNAKQNLNDAFLRSGQEKAGAYSTAAGLTQQNANLEQNLGQFNAGVSEANAGMQSDILGQKTNIVGAQAGFAKDQYNASLNDWLQNLSWEETKAMANDPLSFATDFYSNKISAMTGVAQSTAISNSQSEQSRRQNDIAMLAIMAKIMGGGAG